MNDLLFIGDPHGLLPEVATEIAPLRPKAVIGLGDFDLDRPLEREVEPLSAVDTEFWSIHGNHDNDGIEYYYRLFHSAPPLPDRNLHARVVEIGGIRIAGLGGIFKGKVWRPDRDVSDYRQALWKTRRDWLNGNRKSSRFKNGVGLHLRDAIFPEDFDALWSCRADVLVTHEAPSCHQHGFAVIDELASAMGAFPWSSTGIITPTISRASSADASSSSALELAGVLSLSADLNPTLVRPGRRSLRASVTLPKREE